MISGAGLVDVELANPVGAFAGARERQALESSDSGLFYSSG